MLRIDKRFCAMPAAILLGLVGCSRNPAATENGNETEGASFLPGAIALDISELPDEEEEDGAGKVRQLGAFGSVGFDRTVRAAGQIAHTFQKFADRSLRLGRLIQADMGDPGSSHIEGSVEVDGETVTYRADFSAFDFDGDGDLDGSGTADAVPIAVRIWVDLGGGFERFLCALITVLPSEDNAGAGQMIVQPHLADNSIFSDTQLNVRWDRTDRAHAWNDAFITGRVRGNIAVSAANARVDVRNGEDGSLRKTVRSTSEFTESRPWGFDSFLSAVHHVRGTDALLASALTDGGEVEVSFNEVCLAKANRDQTESGECQGFDTQDMSYLPPPTGMETAFPADFPETPTVGQ